MKYYDKLIFELSKPGRCGYSLPANPWEKGTEEIPAALRRSEEANLPEVSELDVVRHYTNLSNMNFGVDTGFYPLGSCTMKYNPKINEEMAAMPGFKTLHPLQPDCTVQGTLELYYNLNRSLSAITGMAEFTLNPFAGAHGELTGLMVIRQYHLQRGDLKRTKIIVPDSAHGTNPASAAVCGLEVVEVKSTPQGTIDIESLRPLLDDTIAGIMMTNPNTLGLFETEILEIAKLVHECGGLLYYDGANFNPLLGKVRPGDMGFDVLHLNLHKTFSTPHGGGGPGVGPICVAEHLRKFLPSHSIVPTGGDEGITAVASAPWGSAMLFPITYGYIKMLGGEGLKAATEMAIVNANYMSSALKSEYRTYYSGETGRVGHEMILDLTHFKKDYNIDCGDIAHRLMDYGFHAPTLSFPVHETLMVEPTESEPKAEMDRFIATLIQIKRECEEAAASGEADNVVVNAPHTAAEICGEWSHPYTREKAAFPLEFIRESKFFPYVSKIDNGYGDRNLVCRCTE